jgi:hypothetical protein
MGDSRYKRVSRARPCLICGKPDWCSRAADESVSFCARITNGADRLSKKERWGVFYHERAAISQSRDFTGEPRNSLKQDFSIPLAPLEIRDYIYNALFRLSPASRHDIITIGAKGLRERGLTNYQDYGSLPAYTKDRQELAEQLRLLLNQNFPNFVRANPSGLAHVPGFWIDKNGEARLWQKRNYSQPLLLIPYRNPSGKIQACQIRFTGILSQDAKRYLWLSVPKNNSAGCGTPIHFADWKEFGKSTGIKHILVTEGAIKADIVNKLLPEYFAIANSGIGCAQDLIVSISRGRSMRIAFDSDYHQNPSVIRQLARFLRLRLADNRTNNSHFPTEILHWSANHKGIDDALLNASEISALSIPQWISQISNASRSLILNELDDFIAQ